MLRSLGSGMDVALVRGITSDIQRLHKTRVYYRASNWTTGTGRFVIEKGDNTQRPTPFGSLLVHDTMPTLSTANRFAGLDFILGTAIWNHPKRRHLQKKITAPAQMYSISGLVGGMSPTTPLCVPPTCGWFMIKCLFIRV